MRKILSTKMQKFADEYILTGNATTSAVSAGYSKKYAAQNVDKLLKNTKVAEYISQKMNQMSSEKLMGAQEVLETLTSIARSEVPDVTVVTLKKPTVIQVEGAKGVYDKLTYEEEAQAFEAPTKNSDRVRAMELLGKRYSLWTDKVDITSSDITIRIGGDDDGD